VVGSDYRNTFPLLGYPYFNLKDFSKVAHIATPLWDDRVDSPDLLRLNGGEKFDFAMISDDIFGQPFR
jgi:hypothetical protein